MHEYDLDKIRARYTALSRVCYLNTGTVGVMSEPTLHRHIERISHYERFGHFGEAEARAGYEEARSSIARLIGAVPGEIAITRNASDGVNLILSGIECSPGSVLVSTTEEHPAVLLPLSIAARKFDARVELIDITGSDEEILTRFQRLLQRENVEVAILSHVSCETGRRLPVAEICRMCAEAGARTLVDGAQSVGQLPVDVSRIGCDFMTGNGHKWLCGPKGTGFLYVRQSAINQVTPRYVGDGAIDPKFDRARFDPNDAFSTWNFRSDAQRFEFGTRNWHLFGALSDSINELDNLGWASIFRHASELSSYLKSALDEIPAVNVHTPAEWDLSCGLVTFSVAGWDGTALSDQLWSEYDVVQRRVQEPNAVRVSCAHYNSIEDVDRLLKALESLTATARNLT